MRKMVLDHLLKFETLISGCDSMAQVSLQQFGSYGEFEGPQPTVGKGYSKIAEKIAADIPQDKILLNTEVVLIEYAAALNSKAVNGYGNKCDSTHDKIKVSFSNKDSKYYDHVIYTGSLGCLKTSHNELFTPPLPVEKQRAIDRLGIGTVDKIFLQFPNLDFLPSHVQSLNTYFDKNTLSENVEHPFPKWTTKLHSFTVVNKPHLDMLEAWISGEEAEHMETLSDEQIATDCVLILQQFLQVHVPGPTRIIRSNWFSNRHTRGSYSYVAVGSTTQHIKDLANPICDVNSGKPLLLLAGEATHPSCYSTTHGAYLSGERAANTIIDYYKPRVPQQDND